MAGGDPAGPRQRPLASAKVALLLVSLEFPASEVRIAETILEALERPAEGPMHPADPTADDLRQRVVPSGPLPPASGGSPSPDPAIDPERQPAQVDGDLAARAITCPTARIGSQGTDGEGKERWGIETRQLSFEVFEQPLGEGLALELVEIPAGTFLMGVRQGRRGRSAYRDGSGPGDRGFNVGFRVCCLPPRPSS